jgi:general secretion pathway protein G
MTEITTTIATPTPVPGRLTLAAARGQGGMTLIEILIVIAIIGIVMAVVVVNVVGGGDEAKKGVAFAEEKKIEAAYAKWSIDSPEGCPTSIDDLKHDLGKRANDHVKDPWGSDYLILCGDSAPPECEGFCVKSKGKDKKEGTEDDIKSWEKPSKK